MRVHVFRNGSRVAVAVAALLLFAPPASAGQPAAAKFDRVVAARAGQLTGRSRVIVQFHGAPDARVIIAAGGIPGRRLDAAQAQVAEVDNTALQALAASPLVRRVSLDGPAAGTLERSGAALGATLAREEFDVSGRGVGVAVIDSGITSWHEDLYLTRGRTPRKNDRIVYFKDFTRDDVPTVASSEHPFDDYGHGTHVAGIIAGNGFNSDGARMGIAPSARLLGLKVLDAEGRGYVSDVIAAIDHAVALRQTYNVRIINVSVGAGVYESYETDPLAQATRRAVDKGIVVVTSAGNIGTDEHGRPISGAITSPGNAPWVITVGAASHEGTAARGDDTIAAFSSRGPTRLDRAVKPDLVAYGVGIESLADPRTTFYTTYEDYLLPGTRRLGHKPYLSLSGTSMAAPAVTGTIALMLEANPTLTPNAVKAILQFTAQERDGESYFAQGAGLLNARGAVRLAEYFADPRRAFPEPGDEIVGEWVAWSQEIVWGNARYAGGVPLPGSNAWALGVTWGADATASGQRIIWGATDADGIVWGENADGIVWGEAADGIVWGENDEGIVWGENDEGIVWGENDEGIVWGENDEGIVWGESSDGLVWGEAAGGVVWSEYRRRRAVPGRR